MAKNNDTKYSLSVFLCDNLQNGCQLKECDYLRKQNLIRTDNANWKNLTLKENTQCKLCPYSTRCKWYRYFRNTTLR